MQGEFSIRDCISDEEKKKRFGVAVTNSVIWLGIIVLTLLSYGVVLLIAAAVWLLENLLANYNVKKLHALGTSVSDTQFHDIEHTLAQICEKAGVKKIPHIIILNESSGNAFAVKIARKKVIVLYRELIEDMVDKPGELGFLLGHELAHIILDHGARGVFERYKPNPYKAARELTCDNFGLLCSGDLEASKIVLKKLCVGNKLHARLDERHLADEARHLYSGFSGWLLKKYLSHPPVGKRLEGVSAFAEGIQA